MSVIITLGKCHFGAEFGCGRRNISPISPRLSNFRLGTGPARHLNMMGHKVVKLLGKFNP